MANILTMILAGGEGRRLFPLTEIRSKPSVPFGGSYRVIDFVLSNFLNSGLLKIYLVTQFKSHSLMQHLRQGWSLTSLSGKFIDPIPAQMQKGKQWYQGTADAIYQNLNLVEEENCDLVCIFGGDHIYKMDIRQMIYFHSKKQADLTVVAIPVHKDKAHHFGVIEINEDSKMIGFEEKPKENPKTIPGNSEYVLASMGNYIFNRDILIQELTEDSHNSNSQHDFGKNIIPNLYLKKNVFVYDFLQNEVPGVDQREKGYWRDVGTIDSYWEANMDLIAIDPIFNLYNQKWPINTYNPSLPPAKFVHFSELRSGQAFNSIISPGCIISGSLVDHCIFGYNIRAHSFSHITHSVIMHNVEIGRGCKINRAVIDSNVKIDAGVEIGIDLEKDRKKYYVSENGIIVIPKNTIIKNES